MACSSANDSDDDDEEYPEGEEQDALRPAEFLGHGVGFGIVCAIHYNFLANRTPGDLRAYLKNRRVPHQARTAREMRRVFDAMAAS